MKSPVAQSVTSHMCALGMTSKDEIGVGPVLKPIRFLSNSMATFAELDRRCPGCSRHVQLLSGRAAKAAIYPRALCQAVCRGLKTQMEVDYEDMIAIPIKAEEGPVDIDSLWEQQGTETYDGMIYWDDVSGKTSSRELVEAARMEEIEEAQRMEVWEEVPRSQAIARTGRPPIGTRWVDTDKGDKGHPKVRRRLVAQEIRKNSNFEMFVATPPCGVC